MMIVEARYYHEIVDELARGAIQVLEQQGSTFKRFEVPGAFEIPAAVRMAIRSMDFSLDRRRFDGYVCLGCVIRGETSHYDIVANESARGLMDLGVHHGALIGNGILTTDTGAQARKRAGPDRPEGKDKGGDAARAALALLQVRRCMKA